MFIQKIIGIMRYSLPTVNINRINLFITVIKMHFHDYLVFYIGQKQFNILKILLFIEKSVVGQLIILNRSMMT